MAIILILVALSTAGLVSLRQNTDVGTSTHQIIAALQLARNKALASENDSNYGVHFESNKYVLFTGSTYSASAPDNEVHELKSTVEVHDINLVGGSDVVFDRVQGTTSNSGSVGVRLINDSTNSRAITVLASGHAGLTGSVSPTDTRITDTRHLHFDLGWSIQGATTLTLTFADPPNPTVQENVTMASYFDVGQTVFDWEGTVDVNGSDQKLRIHTHSIGASDTLLSIHRDRRDNTKAVTIDIDGQEIVSYTADGTATVGPSGGTIEQQ